MEFKVVQERIREVTHTSRVTRLPSFNFFWFRDVNPHSGTEKRRWLGDPNPAMRYLHEWFIRYLRGLHVPMPSATGGIPGMSVRKNLERHRRRHADDDDAATKPFHQHFYLIDLSSAYHTLEHVQILDIISKMVPPNEANAVRDFLSQYCIDHKIGGLITGANASPQIFNMCLEALIDRKLRRLCDKHGIVYSRYIDDLAFSSPEVIGEKKRRAIRKIIEEAGLKINHKKCQVWDLAKGPVNINGIGVRQDGTTFLPRHALKKLNGMLHIALAGSGIKESHIRGHGGLFIHLLNVRSQTDWRVYAKYMRYVRRQNDERERIKIEKWLLRMGW